jgi:hypothetical protein
MIECSDLPMLAVSLARDEHHKDTQPEFFLAPGTVAKVYEDEQGPILIVRGSKALRLDLQYIDNNDTRRNLTAMLGGFDGLVTKAKENGFQEVIFNTNSPLLETFCIRRFGFVKSGNELRKLI